MENALSNCPICSSNALAPLHLGGTALLHCNGCDITFLKELPDKNTLAEYYASNYVMSNDDIIASEHRRLFRHTEQHALVHTLQEMGLKAGDNILDIGCDKGYFLDEARRFGFLVKGVEPSQSARQYCSRIQIDVSSTLEEVHDSFNAITMWHVLEHFPDPNTLLQEISKHLKPGGFVFVRVPNFSNIWCKIFGKFWIWFQPQNHYFHYSPASLRTLFLQNGFHVHSCISQKPNNRFTNKSSHLADTFYGTEFRYKISLKKRLVRVYENFTGVELFLIAQKNNA